MGTTRADRFITCRIPGCYGPPAAYTTHLCQRHVDNPAAPPMRIECECAVPDVQPLRVFGADCAQCRRCGSPIR